MTKMFIDTEFMEDGRTIELLSLAIVAENGQEAYWVNYDADHSKANDWVKENVLPQLQRYHPLERSPLQIAKELQDFVRCYQTSSEIEFWGYYSAYDWVAVCQLFGRMIDLPKGWPMYCNDIKQLCHSYGNPQLPAQGKGEHNALDDARWNRASHDWLRIYSQ